jgi:hypothetical protein
VVMGQLFNWDEFQLCETDGDEDTLSCTLKDG